MDTCVLVRVTGWPPCRRRDLLHCGSRETKTEEAVVIMTGNEEGQN